VEDVARRRWWILAAVWAAAIFVASSVPGRSLPTPGFRGVDKLVHLVEFGLLGGLLTAAWRAGPALLVTIAWGVLDEVHQHYTPNRDPSVYDALADALGAALGAGLALWLVRRSARRRRHADRS
jgi:VanZ family protein